jgi:hypothetical protein
MVFVLYSASNRSSPSFRLLNSLMCVMLCNPAPVVPLVQTGQRPLPERIVRAIRAKSTPHFPRINVCDRRQFPLHRSKHGSHDMALRCYLLRSRSAFHSAPAISSWPSTAWAAWFALPVTRANGRASTAGESAANARETLMVIV